MDKAENTSNVSEEIHSGDDENDVSHEEPTLKSAEDASQSQESGEVHSGDKEKVESHKEPILKSPEDASHSHEPEAGDDQGSTGDEQQIHEEGAAVVNEKARRTSSQFRSLSSLKYDAYLLSLIKTLVGGHQVRQWLNLGMGMRVIENTSITLNSWQRPPFLIDPNGRGLELVRRMEKHQKVVEIDVGDR